MKPLIFHVDVNSAYLSWEAVKRVSEGKEDIRNIPSAIGGDRDKRRGVILAKSIPAKKMGVKSGEPVDFALRKCPQLLIAEPDFRLYERCSRKFMDICRKYAPALQKYSVDECFLDMSGTEKIYPDPILTAHEIKNEIRDTLGFTVNIGISTNKLLAKMASDFEKPDKVHTLFPEEIKEKLWVLPVEELFSVGKSTASKLKRVNILTIGDLACADVNFIKAQTGEKLGLQLHNYANGIDESAVLPYREEAKGYSISETFAEDIKDKLTAEKAILSLADSVSARMRADNARAACVSLTIKSSSFKSRSHQKKLSQATDITERIYEISKMLFNELWDGKTPIRLLGIYLSCLEKGGYIQESIFEDKRGEKLRKLDKTIDSIRKRYGKNKIVRGSVMDTFFETGKKYDAQIMEMEDTD